MVTIVIAYAAGVPEILDVCLASLARHKPGCPVKKVKVVTDVSGYLEAVDVLNRYPELPLEAAAYNIGTYKTGSEMHGKLLDMAVTDSDSEYILTLDSDCFPVADNWLAALMEMHRNGLGIAGILWPWIPPPADTDEDTIEYKIRKYQCYNCTQVACQLVERDFLVKNSVSFLGSRDTGFSVIDKAWEMGMKVGGMMPTRCPTSTWLEIDAEMNRMCYVIYGDMVYHHGAATRSVTTGHVDPNGFFNDARERVIREKGAEWMLEPGNSYQYKFDKEEGVAQFKMESMFASMRVYLQTHDRIFEPEWGFR
jgi:hypothetical protein